ncbi:hypothetical protein [Arthrobacter sp. 9MFCol3.1]|uniref:hypothetical protein n=1 Tax=Arthrobacter sp. 9MFCol3.1 TaxID=1150398 RepID=UPI000A93D0F0|nr:hypothetical protein [Arthrobacter sp. 9MFCol3.1]
MSVTKTLSTPAANFPPDSPESRLIVYEGGTHGLPGTEREPLDTDLPAVIDSASRT